MNETEILDLRHNVSAAKHAARLAGLRTGHWPATFLGVVQYVPVNVFVAYMNMNVVPVEHVET